MLSHAVASPGGQGLAQRARHFAAGFRFGLEEPEAMRRLHGLTKDLHRASRLDSLLARVLDGAMSLMGADMGNIQLLDPVSGSLWLVTQSGFSSDFLDYFAIVDNGDSACGRAATSYAQAVIPDVNADASFARHREIAAGSGFRSVQSTPLTDYAGRLVGVISTHFRRPHLPLGRDLRIMELYSDFAGEAVARHLGVPPGDGMGDPVRRAVISALLGPEDGQELAASAPPGLVDGPVALSGSEKACRRLATEVAQLRQALRSRIVVEQAKGIVMAERRCGPEDAFKILRAASNNSNVKLRDLAGELVEQAQQGRSKHDRIHSSREPFPDGRVGERR